MVDRIKYIVVDGVHAIPIIPLLFELTRGVVLQISPGVNFIVNVIVEASPVSNFHFIMCVERGGIKGVDVSRDKFYLTLCKSECLAVYKDLKDSSIWQYWF